MPHRFLRDSFAGRIVYHLSGHKYFKHPEEEDDYVIPEKYYKDYQSEKNKGDDLNANDSDETIENHTSNNKEKDYEEEDKHLIIVDWEGPNDPDNPKNWPTFERCFFILEVAFLTTSVYMASAIYTPGILEIRKEFHVGQPVANLGVFAFVFAYGLGPIVWSPMSENAIFGRSSIYIVTLFIFVILQIPTALVDNIAGFVILRFLAGFFASPCLATGAASVGDVTKDLYLPAALATWSIGAVAGPSMGPFFGAILSVKGGWRWCFWFMLIVSGATMVVLFFFLPETYGPTLLARKAKRLRARTGNDRITSAGILENERRTKREIMIETFWRPIEVTILEPVVFLIDMYIAMVYSVLYLFFEVFPIYFVETKGFTIIELGVSYLSLLVGVLIACSIYIPVIHHKFTVPLKKGEKLYPEVFIPIAIVGGTFFAGGLFIFGWSATTYTHWVGPLFGVMCTSAGTFLMFQTLFNYLGASFKSEYAASVYASNDLVRSTIAAAFPIFGASIFNNTRIHKFPVAWGSSILGFIATAMIAIPILFYLNGPKLRARSKYAR
ncbi:MDR1 [Candida pseudojiufengensis]|uniref:MDR1 n=1 Tax=Candida pseudojiufengensis TaxID=497109 RepID=UPI002223FB03|nr:MDR1 [Candida pseudojiufengensis]KAI5963812.1 MDR1 [Candida pseudojiufengensis]